MRVTGSNHYEAVERSRSSDSIERRLSLFVHGLAFFTALSYGVYHLIFQSLLIAGLSLIACVGIFMSEWRLMQGADNRFFKYAFVIALTIDLTVTSYQFGYRGLVLVFPLTASFLFLLGFRLAIGFSLISIFSACVAALHVLGLETVVRFGLAQLLSTGFSAAFAYSLNKQKEALDNDANEDYLTGATSRRGFTHWLDFLASTSGSSDSVLTLFYIDIDDFKMINDTHGHALGDALLSMFCQRVIKCLRSSDKVVERGRCINFSRLAGDEFALAIPGLASRNAAERVARRIVKQLSTPFVLSGGEVWIHVSIGILQSVIQPGQANALLNKADKAMYDAKLRGKNQYQFFNAGSPDTSDERQRIEAGLINALRNDRFDLAFMPIYDCDTLKVVGAEALLRCTGEGLEELAPCQFVTVAEQRGLIREIDLLVLEKAFSRINGIAKDDRLSYLWFAINISAQELYNPEFPSALARLLRDYEIPPARIELEITETSLVLQDDTCIDILRQIKALGIRLSLDDFGTGYTAFNQLMHYPIDQLKIDRSFVAKLVQDQENEPSIIEIVLAIAGHYRLDVVAEGVECWEQVDYLRAQRCRYLQGYLLSKPVDWKGFLRLAIRDAGEVKTLAAAVGSAELVAQTPRAVDRLAPKGGL